MDHLPWRRVAATALVLAAVACALTAYLFARLDGESAIRTDQVCRLFETDHLADVTRLRNTYAYLDALPAKERGAPLNRALLRQLPQLEDEAGTDQAPEFCDEPGVGLPEPDPVLPKKPESLKGR